MGALRTFPAGYQPLAHGETPYSGGDMPRAVDTARVFLAIVGAIFAVGGVVLALTFDRLVGIGFLIVGAFLLILPFSTMRTDE